MEHRIDLGYTMLSFSFYRHKTCISFEYSRCRNTQIFTTQKLLKIELNVKIVKIVRGKAWLLISSSQGLSFYVPFQVRFEIKFIYSYACAISLIQGKFFKKLITRSKSYFSILRFPFLKKYNSLFC